MPRKHVLVKGYVQGIGFRWFVERAAAKAGVVGWVRNMPNGDLEAEAEGGEEALGAFMRELRSGHPYARVDTLEVRDIPDQGEKAFRIKGW